MNLEVRKVGKRKKYYLAHSYREKGRVAKLRIFIGTDISEDMLGPEMKAAEIKLKERLISLKAIKDPYETVLAHTELEKLKSVKPTAKIRMAHLSEEDWLKFTELFSYDSNAIEGSTVLKKEAKNIIEEGKWPDKSADEISETLGVAEAVAYIRKTGDHLSLDLIRELHRIVFKNSKGFAGRFRSEGVEVVVKDHTGTVIHRGAPQTQVVNLLKRLVKWYKSNARRYPPIVLAAVVHNQFEVIHPFQDGNGRVGRLLLINILVKHRLPPVNIELKNRKQYYDAISAYENNDDIRPMIELILKEYKNLNNMIN
ncbi:MAG: Fic family protein [Candidatus Micrarchaeales archaeon]